MDKKEETRRFESEILALPPLKMYLVHASEQAVEKAASKPSAPKKSRQRYEQIAAVLRLIDRLSEEE